MPESTEAGNGRGRLRTGQRGTELDPSGVRKAGQPAMWARVAGSSSAGPPSSCLPRSRGELGVGAQGGAGHRGAPGHPSPDVPLGRRVSVRVLRAGSWRPWWCCPVPSSSPVCPAGPAEPPGASEPGDGPPAEAGVPGGLAAAGSPDAAAVPWGEWGPSPRPPGTGPHPECGGTEGGVEPARQRGQGSRRPVGAWGAERVGERGSPTSR